MEHSNNIVVEERPNDTQPGDVTNCIKRYQLASTFCEDKFVLDYGTGYGFGLNTLYKNNVKGTGTDIYGDVVLKARHKFPMCNFMHKELKDIDLSIFDVVICMEVIEHLENEDLHILLETFSKNVPEIIASTPNGNFFKYKPKTKAERKGYHVQHFEYIELEKLFKQYYKNVEVVGMAFDSNPAVNRFTGFFVYAKGKI